MRTVSLSLLMFCLFACGCDRPIAHAAAGPADLPLGARCTVQFKRDLLGGTAQLPIPPTTNSINGAEVSVSGKLVDLNAEWVVVDTGNRQIWIPRQNILLMQF